MTLQAFLRAPLRAIALAACLLIAACAQEVGLIDRSQPGALDKKVLEGEWYFQRTVVDAPYTAGFTFVGEADELERVRWEIGETHLTAYRSYDFVAGTDLDHSKRGKPGEKVSGQPVAVYAISSHFDIQRTYSTSTGEQGNVLQENTDDRPWYQRRYLRVDWSQNLARNFLFTIDTIDTEPVKFAITDPADPDAFTLAWRDASMPSGWRDSRDPTDHREATSADYMDVVTKVLASPGTVSGWDDYGPYSFPACWFYMAEDCKPAEIKIRTSMRKVDPADDYEPLAYPDNAVARDAAGKVIRVKHHVEVKAAKGATKIVESSLPTHLISRDPKGEPVRIPWFDKFGYFRAERYGYDPLHGEVESARKLFISRWNIWDRSTDEAGKPLPVAKRKPRPVVYYLGQGYPDELVATADRVAEGWNLAFRTAVSAAQGTALESVPAMFIIKRNTLKLDAKSAVVDRGQRVGDLRYALLNYITEPTRAGLLGYGPSATDPTTGQVISASANVYGAALKEYATSGRDLVRLARGEIEPEQFGLGHLTEAEVAEGLKKFKGTLPGGGKGKPAADKPEGKAAWAHDDSPGGAAGSPGHAEAVAAARQFAKQVTNPKKKQQVHALVQKAMKDREGWVQARAALLEGKAVADVLIGRDILLAFGAPETKKLLAKLPPGSPLPAMAAAQKNQALPGNWAPMAARMREVMRARFLAKHNITHASFADDAVLGIVEENKDKDAAGLWTIIHEAVYRSTAEHELGHTFGLRHNFEGSTDALNYFPKYWTLRGKDGAALDKPNEEQKKAGMDDYKYSSIMDYAQRFHSDIHGLGAYDVAAIVFGYAQAVQVFAQPPVDKVLELVPMDVALKSVRHYTAIPKMLGGVDAIAKRKWVPYATVIAEMTGEGTEPGKPMPRKVFEVPYRFCSDEYTMGTPTCNMFDHGADSLEIVNAALAQYRDHYFLHAFRRDRTDFTVEGYYGRVWERFFLPTSLQYQNWVFDQGWWDPKSPAGIWEQVVGLQENEDKPEYGVPFEYWEGAPLGGLAMTTSVQRGFEKLAQVLTTPEPGSYCLNKVTNRYIHAHGRTDLAPCAGKKCNPGASNGCADLTIPVGVGRFHDTEYDVDTGYYYYDRLRHVGSFYDKLAAMSVLTDPSTYFIGVDSSQPVHNYILGYGLYFGPELNRIFGAMAAGHQELISPRLNKEGLLKGQAWFGPDASKPGTQPFIDAPGMFMLRNYAMFEAMAWLNCLWDQTFNDSMKIYVQGSGEAFAPAKDAVVASFTTPFNQRTYLSTRMAGDAFSPGWTMVNDAAQLAQAWSATKDPDTKADLKYEIDEATQVIEVARGMYDVFGYAWF